ncbi:MAG: hypothetical protein WD229_14090 [Pirellulales bacterium]
MNFILDWLLEQRSTVAAVTACVLLAITAVLRYGFDLWWPWGIVMATVCAVVAMVSAGGE